VAQHVAALLLDFARGIVTHSQSVKAGEWTSSIDWCYARQPMFELSGKTFGVVGIGRIGIAAAGRLSIIKHWPMPCTLGH
jgi:glycerate dehydrogenase